MQFAVTERRGLYLGLVRDVNFARGMSILVTGRAGSGQREEAQQNQGENGECFQQCFLLEPALAQTVPIELPVPSSLRAERSSLGREASRPGVLPCAGSS